MRKGVSGRSDLFKALISVIGKDDRSQVASLSRYQISYQDASNLKRHEKLVTGKLSESLTFSTELADLSVTPFQASDILIPILLPFCQSHTDYDF